MGVVYKAKDTRLDRSVALKFLPAQRLDNKTALERLQPFIWKARPSNR